MKKKKKTFGKHSAEVIRLGNNWKGKDVAYKTSTGHKT